MKNSTTFDLFLLRLRQYQYYKSKGKQSPKQLAQSVDYWLMSTPSIMVYFLGMILYLQKFGKP